MRRSSPTTRVLLAMAMLALLVVRIGDIHLHLCFDGQEAPASVHVNDASVHHDGEHEPAGEAHADNDVDPFLGTLVKKADLDAAFALIPLLLVLALLAPPLRTSPLRLFTAVPVLTSPFSLRPPLRGPPL
jgi:hypothetical protein